MAQNEQICHFYQGGVYPLRLYRQAINKKINVHKVRSTLTKLTVIVYSGSQTKSQIKAFFQRLYFQATNLEMLHYIKVLTLYMSI